MAVQLRRHRFNVDRYYKLAEVGVLSEDDKVELLDGRIMEMHPPAPRRFTIDEYQRMIEGGVFAEDDRIELIEGEIIEMSPIGKRHAGVVNRVAAFLHTLLGGQAVIAVQNPIQLSQYSEPQPDIAVLKFREDYYSHDLPTPSDTIFLIEVADMSLVEDRGAKVPLYARAGIPEVWLVNLPEDRIEVYAQPYDGVYQKVRQARRGQSVTVPGFADASLKVDDILA